jgi:hypothetical protein
VSRAPQAARHAAQFAVAAYGVLGHVHLSQLRELGASQLLQATVQRLAATDGSVAAAHDTAAAAAIVRAPSHSETQ